MPTWRSATAKPIPHVGITSLRRRNFLTILHRVARHRLQLSTTSPHFVLSSLSYPTRLFLMIPRINGPILNRDDEKYIFMSDTAPIAITPNPLASLPTRNHN